MWKRCRFGEGGGGPGQSIKKNSFFGCEGCDYSRICDILEPPQHFKKKFLFNFFLHVSCNSTKSITVKELLL